MADEQPQDPEAGWPPRFETSFIGWSALVLILVFAAVAGGFRDVFQDAGLLSPGEDAARNVAAYVLFVSATFSMLAALVFGLVESRRPPTTVASTETGLRAGAGAGGVAIDKVLTAFGDRKLSRVLLAIAFVLFVGAASTSGVVGISVGGDDSSGSADADAVRSEDGD